MLTPPGAAPVAEGALMRLKSGETFIGLVGSTMTPMRAPGRTIGMYSRGIASLISTGYGAPTRPTGVTCRPSL